MKTFLFASLIFLTFITNVKMYPQNHWNVRGSGGSISSFSFPSGDTGYYSSISSIFKTTNNAQTWNPLFVVSNPYKIWFVNGITGYFVSDYNIKKTTDGGNNWISVWGNKYIGCNEIMFADVNTGWICNGSARIYRTINGGTSWDTTEFTGTIAKYIPSLYFINANTGYIIDVYSNSLQYIKKTTNCGTNWFDVYAFTGHDYFCKIQFINENTGWLLGHNEFYKTTNGGVNWLSVSIPGFSYTFCFADNDIGYLSCLTGLYKTSNSGVNWVMNYPHNNYYYLLLFKNANTGWYATLDAIIKTTDGGLNWVEITKKFPGPLGGLSVINSNTAFSGLIKTTDAGSNWFKYTSFDPGTYGVFATYFLDDNTGYITSEYFSYPNGYRQYISRTTNGGSSFGYVYLAPFYSFDRFTFINFMNTLTGWATGLKILCKTTNSGSNWNILNTLPTGVFKNVNFFNDTLGFAATSEGKILKTTNGGVNFFAVQDISFGLKDMFMLDSNTGWVCGTGGSIYKTSNGWLSKEHQISNSDKELYSVYFTDSNTGWICGEAGVVLKTVNSGILWKIDMQPFGSSLYDVMFFDNLTGVCTGNVILNTTTGGATYINKTFKEISVDSYLFQNSPNPFNADSRIKFKIFKAGGIKIDFHDITGRVVRVMAEKYMTPGLYEIIFNGTNLSSGIYFYRLFINGNFIESKKMVLLK